MAKDLDKFSDEELKAELKKRDDLRASQPTPNPNPDWSLVIANAEYYINELAQKGYVDEDTKQYIFESVIEAIYGKSVWKDFVNPILS